MGVNGSLYPVRWFAGMRDAERWEGISSVRVHLDMVREYWDLEFEGPKCRQRVYDQDDRYSKSTEKLSIHVAGLHRLPNEPSKGGVYKPNTNLGTDSKEVLYRWQCEW